MKKVFIGLLLVIVFSSLSMAEILLPASSLGQGRLNIKGGYIGTTNSTAATNNTVGYDLLIGYGIQDNFDLYGVLGYTDANNMGAPPAIFTSWSLNGPTVGAILKYGFLKETPGLPINLSGVAAYRSTNLTYTAKAAAATNTNNFVTGDISGGIVVSKLLDIAEPYLGVLYHSYSTTPQAGAVSTGNILEIAGGAQIKVGANWNVNLEYSSNNITGQSGSKTTNNQIVAGVGYGL